MAGNYACFGCGGDPTLDRVQKSLDDRCPTCGHQYGLPGYSPPTGFRSDQYRVLAYLGRGFYAATYLAVMGALDHKIVLKVAPRSVYTRFGKRFDQECRAHADVASESEHLVGITDYFDEVNVQFGEVSVDCHVAVLDYVEGESLSDVLSRGISLPSDEIAQISVDLLTLLSELSRRHMFHNDLHESNIIVQRLRSQNQRAQAINGQVRAVAIDLGSLANEDLEDSYRVNDLKRVVRHLFSLAGKLLDQPELASDVDYRVASSLDEIYHVLSPDFSKQRTPDYDQYIEMIVESYQRANSPWTEPGTLRRFGDSYNAQHMHAWHVSRLLVDPDGEWAAAISGPGPQVITGMRGCGKTMLLRSLEFHARVYAQHASDGAPSSKTEDPFVGLYASCTRLLDVIGAPTGSALHEPFARLLIAYAREGLRALRHLARLGPKLVSPGAPKRIAEAIAAHLGDSSMLAVAETDPEFERQAQRMLVSLDRGESRHLLLTNPVRAFDALTEALSTCAPSWAGKTILYLLDDVTTRNLRAEAIAELFGALLSQGVSSAFKMTTEVQTFELALRSPGLIEKARERRDYTRYDLGTRVNERLRERHGQGKEFLADILDQRAAQYPNHPVDSPRTILGDVSLRAIAQEIARTGRGLDAVNSKKAGSSTKDRKRIYRGLSALAAVCVGDIGDVITIYDQIMARFRTARTPAPAPAEMQSACFQEYCIKRLFYLSRRKDKLKQFALGFGAANHDLLVSSWVDRVGGVRWRDRQYSSIYIRIPDDPSGELLDQIIELVDAAVFVLEGGPDSPRAKGLDRDPINQFILSYRKLYGLSTYIGLAERDRFELKGSDLEEWLDHPERSKEILLRNLGGERIDDVDDREEPEDETDEVGAVQLELMPKLLVRMADDVPDEAAAGAATPAPAIERTSRRYVGVISATALSHDAVAVQHVETIVVGLGFEERTLTSIERIIALTKPTRAILVRLPLPGQGAQIEALVTAAMPDVTVVDVLDLSRTLTALGSAGKVLVDTTGLTKPPIFAAVRWALEQAGEAVIAHTQATQHYPLDGDIQPVFAAWEGQADPHDLLGKLGQVWPGEAGPYRFSRLLNGHSYDTRRLVLLAAAAPKAERLLTLTEGRDYDQIELVVPTGENPRSRLARLASEIVSPDASSRVALNSDDLEGHVAYLHDAFNRWYREGGYDVELGLTGSKIHTVACAAATVAFKTAQCWYVGPSTYDAARYSRGAEATTFHLLRVRQRNQ